MTRRFALILALAGGSIVLAQQSAPRVIVETDKGAIEIEVDPVHAPVTTANFLRYVDARLYDGGEANRSVRHDNTIRHDVEIQVIQFQVDRTREREQFPPIEL